MARSRSPRRFACDFEGCDYRCPTVSGLNRHKRKHTGERPFVCDFEGCDRRCTRASDLKRHKHRHTGETPYVCNFENCDYSCARSSSLNRHKLTHTGERPFACDFECCDYHCTTASDLNRHKRKHTGEKPYVCEFEGCDHRCTDASDLNRHKRTHTGERPFVCDFEGCDHRCTTASQLKSHKEALHTARGQQRQKKREERVAKALANAGITFDREVTVQFCGQANRSCARVDFAIYREWGTVLLEVDEHQHQHYAVTCEAARMLNVFAEQMKQGRAGKFHFVRFNPDAYSEGGEVQKTLLNDRLAALIHRINCEPVQQYSVTYLFYDRTDSPLPDVCLDADYPGSLRAIVNM